MKPACAPLDMTGISMRCACGTRFELTADDLREYPGPRAREDLLLDRFNNHKKAREEKSMTKKKLAVAFLLLAALAGRARAIDPGAWDARLVSMSARNMLAQLPAPVTAAQTQAQTIQAQVQANAPQTSAACHTAFCFVWNDWKDAQVTAAGLFVPKGLAFDGAVTDLSVIYNPAIFKNDWPAALTSVGISAPACSFLRIGGGGNSQSGFAHIAAGCNLAPAVVGPVAQALSHAGGNYAAVGTLLLASDGNNGLEMGGGYKATLIKNGGVQRFDQIGAPFRLDLGYFLKF